MEISFARKAFVQVWTATLLSFLNETKKNFLAFLWIPFRSEKCFSHLHQRVDIFPLVNRIYDDETSIKIAFSESKNTREREEEFPSISFPKHCCPINRTREAFLASRVHTAKVQREKLSADGKWKTACRAISTFVIIGRKFPIRRSNAFTWKSESHRSFWQSRSFIYLWNCCGGNFRDCGSGSQFAVLFTSSRIFSISLVIHRLLQRKLLQSHLELQATKT